MIPLWKLFIFTSVTEHYYLESRNSRASNRIVIYVCSASETKSSLFDKNEDPLFNVYFFELGLCNE